VIVGGETGGRWLDGLDRQLRAVLLSPFVGQRLGFFVNKENAADLVALRELIEAGTVTPAVDGTVPLDQVPAAIRRLVDGEVTGKLAVTIG
jgi:NADPH:quinone reductase-like Zn-dependent oxidoreductase